MKTPEICQSCTMPMTSEEVKGTEKDGTISQEYCIYCYQDGEFTHPKISFVQMENFIKVKMKELHIPEDLIQKSLYVLPHLKRWKGDPHLL